MPRFVVLSPVRAGGKTHKPSTGKEPTVVELSARDGRDLMALAAVGPAPEAEPETPAAPKAPANRTTKRAPKTADQIAAEKAAAEKTNEGE